MNVIITNYVLNLTEDNDYLTTSHNTALVPNSWSIQTWVKPSNTTTDGGFILHKNRVYRISYEEDGTIRGDIYNGSNYNSKVVSGSALTTNVWYHIVLTWSGSTLQLYIDGSSQGSTSESNYPTNNSDFFIGERDNTAKNYDGKIDEFAFWNDDLSQSEVTALYNGGKGLSASSNSGNYNSSNELVLYYEFQQNLNDSKNSYNSSGNSIISSDYSLETITK